ncbi:MAG: hypothetical protein ACLRMZ_23640 [Blautia marasmi]
MWFHADGRTPTSDADYGKARAGIAISDSPAGPLNCWEPISCMTVKMLITVGIMRAVQYVI